MKVASRLRHTRAPCGGDAGRSPARWMICEWKRVQPLQGKILILVLFLVFIFRGKAEDEDKAQDKDEEAQPTRTGGTLFPSRLLGDGVPRSLGGVTVGHNKVPLPQWP